jgi:hypothetical protein
MASNMNLTITNKNSDGAASSEVYVCVLGNDPDNKDTKFGYLNLVDGTTHFEDKSSWKLDPTTMVTTLDKIKFPLSIPNINSARIYFSVRENFTAFPASGPSSSRGNTNLFDKIEFDSGSNPNINGTSVDFYGISYVLSGTDVNNGAVSYGFTKTRSEIIKALNDFTVSPEAQESGNTGIMKKTFMYSTDGTDVTRVLAPKTMGLGDWGNTQAGFVDWGTKCSHFLDNYVKNKCFAGGRKFKFYSKMWTEAGPNTTYYGTTPKEGGSINLWTDADCTVPYAPVPTLNLPMTAWPNPDFTPKAGVTSLYHTVGGAQDTIDWGFLLLGNSAGTGAAANWGSDPLCMAIMVSICRGVMHLEDGTTDWIDSSKYYQGNGATPAVSTEDMPIFYYSSILHSKGKDGKAYVLSYDDVYGSNPSIFFSGSPDVTIDLYGLDKVDLKS